MEISPLTLNRLSLYLRCLRTIEADGVGTISSQQLANQFHLSAAQIRKDLAQFGEFGIRGVGYRVEPLAERLTELLGLDRFHPLVIVGMGNLGSARAASVGFNTGCFKVVAGLDNDADKIGQRIGDIEVMPAAQLAKIVTGTEAEIGILTVPAGVAQINYDALADAGVKAILNFAPIVLELRPEVRTKSVDLLIDLEELGYFLGDR
jgi:redox-sensing transcriptional repressor